MLDSSLEGVQERGKDGVKERGAGKELQVKGCRKIQGVS